MKRIFSVICLMLVAALPLVALSEEAAPQKDAPKGPVLPTPYNQGKVKSVDAANMKFEVITGVMGVMGHRSITRVFLVTDDTKISKDGKPVKVADIAAGNFVRLHFKMDGEKSMAIEVLVLEQAPEIKEATCRGWVKAINASNGTMEIQDDNKEKQLIVFGDGLTVGTSVKLAVGKYVRVGCQTDDTGVMIARQMLIHEEKPDGVRWETLPGPEEKK